MPFAISFAPNSAARAILRGASQAALLLAGIALILIPLFFGIQLGIAPATSMTSAAVMGLGCVVMVIAIAWFVFDPE